MDPLKLLHIPVVQDFSIAQALNPYFQDARPVRQTRFQVIGDLQWEIRDVVHYIN